MKIQWNLFSAGTIGTPNKRPLYEDVHFIKIPPEKNIFSEKLTKNWCLIWIFKLTISIGSRKDI